MGPAGGQQGGRDHTPECWLPRFTFARVNVTANASSATVYPTHSHPRAGAGDPGPILLAAQIALQSPGHRYKGAGRDPEGQALSRGLRRAQRCVISPRPQAAS